MHWRMLQVRIHRTLAPVWLAHSSPLPGPWRSLKRIGPSTVLKVLQEHMSASLPSSIKEAKGESCFSTDGLRMTYTCPPGREDSPAGRCIHFEETLSCFQGSIDRFLKSVLIRVMIKALTRTEQ